MEPMPHKIRAAKYEFDNPSKTALKHSNGYTIRLQKIFINRLLSL